MHGKLDLHRSNINLRSNNKVIFKRLCIHTYEVFLKSPLSQCIKVWEMLKSEVQWETTEVKFKSLKI